MYHGIFKAVIDNDVKKVVEALEHIDKSSLKDIVNESEQTPLMLATLQNNVALVSLLLEKGFDPGQKDINELSPFVGAAANGFDDIFELMCLYKPDPEQYNRFGGTALIPSSEKGYLKTMQKALDYGVPVNHQNRLGWSALLEAIILGDGGYLYSDIIRELVKHGADVNQKDFDNKSSIDYAVIRKQKNVLLILKEQWEDEYDFIRSLMRKNLYVDALYELQKMEQSNQQRYYLGMVLEVLNQTEAAEYYYKEGLKTDKQFAFYLAQLYRKQGAVEKAIEAYNYNDEDDYCQYHLSNYLRELNLHKDAINVMNKLLEKDSLRVDYMFHKANSLRSLGRHQEAYEAMDKAYKIMPSNELFREHRDQSESLIKRKEGK